MEKKKKNIIILTLLLLICLVYLFIINLNTFKTDAMEKDVITIIDFDKNNTGYTINGNIKQVKGLDGSNALHIENSSTAQQYLSLGKYDFGADSFSISMWCKISTEQIYDGEYMSLISNKDWSTVINPGFMLGVGNKDGTYKGIYSDFSTIENYNNQKYRYVMYNRSNTDGEWHNFILNINRDDDIELYCDGEKQGDYSTCGSQYKTISSLKGQVLENKEIFIGATLANGVMGYPIKDLVIDNIKISKSLFSMQMIKEESTSLLLYKKIDSATKIIEQAIKNKEISLDDYTKWNNLKRQISDISVDTTTYNTSIEIINSLNTIISNIYDIKDTPILTASVLSDIHIDGAVEESNNDVKQIKDNYVSSLVAMSELYGKLDVTLFPGDFTRNGKLIDFEAFQKITEQYVNSDKKIISIGNHEVKNMGWSDVEKQFLSIKNDWGYSGNKVYYEDYINGIHIICLGTEDIGDTNTAEISNEQLEWFEKTLDRDKDNTKPVIVLLHQPLKDTVALSDKYNVGKQDAELKVILKKHQNVILITGHNHNGFVDDRALLKTEYGYLLDCPAIKQNDLANQSGVLGYKISVYNSKTVIDVVDCKKKEILYEYRKVINNSYNNVSSNVADMNIENIVNANNSLLFDNDITTGVSLEKSSSDNKYTYGIELNDVYKINGLRLVNDRIYGIKDYTLSYSVNGSNYKMWKNNYGTLDNNNQWQKIIFDPIYAKYIRITVDSSYGKLDDKVLINEIRIMALSQKIDKVINPEELIVDVGVAFENLSLPEEVVVKLENGKYKSLRVIWEKGDYSSEIRNTYQIKGIIQDTNLVEIDTKYAIQKVIVTKRNGG